MPTDAKPGESFLGGLVAKAGASIRYGRQRGIMHNKFIIVDKNGWKRDLLILLTTLPKPWRIRVYLWNPKIVGRYVKRFDEIWAKADPVVAEVNPEKGSSR